MAAPDLTTRDKAFAHLKAIILELEAERSGSRRRSTDLEFRIRRLEIALTLTFTEMIARTRPELAERAEVIVDTRIAAESDPAAVETRLRDFVGELQEMAAEKPRKPPSMIK